MKSQWNVTKPYIIHGNKVPGVYSAYTQNGKTIFCYSDCVENAHVSLMNSVHYSDKIISIGRAHIDE